MPRFELIIINIIINLLNNIKQDIPNLPVDLGISLAFEELSSFESSLLACDLDTALVVGTRRLIKDRDRLMSPTNW